nr:MAG TPA: hypothetical protein [Caudoviricetes sp.]
MSICVAKIKQVVGRPPKLILMHFRKKRVLRERL